LFAADEPGQSPIPQRIAYTSTSVTIEVFKPEDNGGDETNDHELWVDGGAPNTNFTKIESHTDAVQEYKA